MVTFISHSPKETGQLGESWARDAVAGWVIGLTGDLGSGKTQFVKGFARGLGVTERVHSPTFALAIEYHGGRLPLYHLDLYRLENAQEVFSAGLEEYFYQRNGVTLVEWAERALSLDRACQPGMRYRRVLIESIGENDRKIQYEDFGD
jgi:tRNA threonylcarbamoyladenosine biosynthesis protein TsaE